MGLTPIEILNKEFDKRFRGYDVEQVNDYLDIIVADFERLISENDSLAKSLEAAQDKLKYFEQLQDSLNNSIVIAQEAGERLKQNARKEAELILFEANKEAEHRVGLAQETAVRIMNETENLRVNGRNFRRQLQHMVESQLAMITDDNYTHLFEEDVVNVLNDIEATVPKVNVKEHVEQLEQQSQVVYNEEKHMIDIPSTVVDDQPEEDIESIVGQTIRIELPKD